MIHQKSTRTFELRCWGLVLACVALWIGPLPAQAALGIATFECHIQGHLVRKKKYLIGSGPFGPWEATSRITFDYHRQRHCADLECDAGKWQPFERRGNRLIMMKRGKSEESLNLSNLTYRRRLDDWQSISVDDGACKKVR